MHSYDFATIEPRWRQQWAEENTYRTPTPEDGQETFYCLDFFPYPSGYGLSVGHGRNYVPSDVVARYQRMRGKAVLHPMGWDAFGLPAENEAMAQGTHPAESTAAYAANYKRQLDLLGCSYDWEREINSSDPAYYRWTQWLFLLCYHRGLAYRASAPVNWCDTCQTVLADEEIEAGTCWRCHDPVVQRPRAQWFMRTTAYADELLADLETLDWPESIITMQGNWIGRSEGIEISFPIAGREETITVFTTRPDTFFGITFFALAPEHPLATALATDEHRAAVEAYVVQARGRRDAERQMGEPDGAPSKFRYRTRASAAPSGRFSDQGQNFQGVPTGAEAVLPNGRRAPIWVADYVVAGHGSGAVMAVPAHDTRDFAFAQRYGLPIQVVIAPPGWDGAPSALKNTDRADGTSDNLSAGHGLEAKGVPFEDAYTEPGTMVHSGRFDGMGSEEAIAAIGRWLEEQGMGRPVVHYRLRDWLISRQRYWGAPIPIVHCPSCGEVPVPENELPVRLPDVPDYRPRGDGRAPLANVAEFVHTTCPQCGGPAERETDTMTGFMCSSWYYMRFASPHEVERPFDPVAVARWLPVTMYLGGVEHAVGHLMYSRFLTKVMADGNGSEANDGLVTFREPFPVLRSQGVLHARDPETGRIERMSKSRGNVVTPDSVIERYGADVTRLYIMFIAPFEASAVWEVEEKDKTTPQHIEGVRRFHERVWRLVQPGKATPAEGETKAEVAHHARRGDRPIAGTADATLSTPPSSPTDRARDPDATPAQRAHADDALRQLMHQTIRDATTEIEAMRYNTAISALMTYSSALEDYRGQHGDTEFFYEARKALVLLLAPLAPFITEEAWHMWGEAGSVHHQSWPTYDPEIARLAEVTMAVQVDGRVRDRVTMPAEADEETVRKAALAAPAVQRALNGRRVVQVIVVPGKVVNVVTR